MRRIHKFLNSSSIERRLLIKTWILLGIIRPGLELLPFSTLRKLLKFNRKFSEDQLFWPGHITRFSFLLAPE